MCISVYLSMLIVIFSCWCSFFFFFKQKTAYEVRISDWSSDVCSSDLVRSLRLIDQSKVEKILHIVDEDAELVRSDGAQAWRTIAWDVVPRLTGAQLIRSDSISPIVHSDAGIQIGRASFRERVCKYV